MEVILLERVHNLGQIGDVVNVKPGYARNFLLPLRKALRATQANKSKFEAQRAQIEATNLEKRGGAEKIRSRVDGLTVVLIRLEEVHAGAPAPDEHATMPGVPAVPRPAGQRTPRRPSRGRSDAAVASSPTRSRPLDSPSTGARSSSTGRSRPWGCIPCALPCIPRSSFRSRPMSRNRPKRPRLRKRPAVSSARSSRRRPISTRSWPRSMLQRRRRPKKAAKPRHPIPNRPDFTHKSPNFENGRRLPRRPLRSPPGDWSKIGSD